MLKSDARARGGTARYSIDRIAALFVPYLPIVDGQRRLQVVARITQADMRVHKESAGGKFIQNPCAAEDPRRNPLDRNGDICPTRSFAGIPGGMTPRQAQYNHSARFRSSRVEFAVPGPTHHLAWPRASVPSRSISSSHSLFAKQLSPCDNSNEVQLWRASSLQHPAP